MANSRLQLVRGNSLIINFKNQDSSGNPISLNGATIYFTVKKTPGYDSTADDSTAQWQITSTGNTGNTCSFTSTPVQTWVNPDTYYWDITIKYADGSVVTPSQGTIEIIGTPTNKAS